MDAFRAACEGVRRGGHDAKALAGATRRGLYYCWDCRVVPCQEEAAVYVTGTNLSAAGCCSSGIFIQLQRDRDLLLICAAPDPVCSTNANQLGWQNVPPGLKSAPARGPQLHSAARRPLGPTPSVQSNGAPSSLPGTSSFAHPWALLLAVCLHLEMQLVPGSCPPALTPLRSRAGLHYQPCPPPQGCRLQRSARAHAHRGVQRGSRARPRRSPLL